MELQMETRRNFTFKIYNNFDSGWGVLWRYPHIYGAGAARKRNCVAIVLDLHASFSWICNSKIDADLKFDSFGDLSTMFLGLNWIVKR